MDEYKFVSCIYPRREGRIGVDKETNEYQKEDDRVAITTIHSLKVHDEENQVFYVDEVREIKTTLFLKDHPGVLGIQNILMDDEKICIITASLTPLQRMRHMLGQFNHRRALDLIMHQVLEVLSFAHSCSVWHQNLQMRNIFINPTGCFVKVNGWNHETTVERFCDEREYARMLGADFHEAPERSHSSKMDVWNAGCIWVALLTNDEWRGIDRTVKALLLQGRGWGVNQVQLDTTLDTILDMAEDVSVSNIDLLHKMLTLDPTQRISAQDALQHSHFDDQKQAQSDMEAAHPGQFSFPTPPEVTDAWFQSMMQQFVESFSCDTE